MTFLRLGNEVADALAAGRGVVALESTIIAHGFPALHHLQESLQAMVAGGLPSTLVGLLYTGVIGMLTGALLVAALKLGSKFFSASRQTAG